MLLSNILVLDQLPPYHLCISWLGTISALFPANIQCIQMVSLARFSLNASRYGLVSPPGGTDTCRIQTTQWFQIVNRMSDMLGR